MISEAVPMALVASIYPLGIAALLAYLHSDSPRPRAVMFLLGAATCTFGLGLLIVLALGAANLGDDSNDTERYGLRLALGLVLLAGAWFVAHRRPPGKAAADESSGSSRIASLADTRLTAVFLVGIALYTPSPAYLTALQVVGTSGEDSAVTGAGVALMAALVLVTLEVPLLLYVFAPGWTVPKLEALHAWLGVHGRALFTGVLAVLGVWQVALGIIGLA